MGFHGDILELCRRTFRKASLVYGEKVTADVFALDLRVLSRLHGISRSIEIRVFDLRLYCHIHYSIDRLLHVGVLH